MKSRETWQVNKEEPIIYPEDLAARPGDFGGMGVHMMCAVQDRVITIPIHRDGSHVSVQTSDIEATKRIERDGAVDILSNGYWCNIRSTVPVFLGTNEPVPVWGQDVGDSLRRAGLIS